MKTRRQFFKTATVLGLAGASPSFLRSSEPAAFMPAGGQERAYWVSVVERLARPVLASLAQRKLRENMPVEEKRGADRRLCTYLEGFGRLLCGIAPWLALEDPPSAERALQEQFIRLAQESLDAATDPQSNDFMNFSQGGQPLVDAAFLAQGILRAPKQLWEPLSPRVQDQLLSALKSMRKITTPTGNNWVMFAAMVEAALLQFGQPTLEQRLENCVRKMLGWYCGDGAYGDGEWFHFDYYNSFVIQPMLLDVLSVLKTKDPHFAPAHASVLKRAARYADVQERLIAPDGTFPCLGRSAAYRFGAFQTLAQVALLGQLPERLKPAQVRCGLGAVIRRMVEAQGTFDPNGWLQIGFCGHQPALGERYISTGSLYLCSTGLLPLGLPVTNEFWSAPPERWSSQKLWSGEDIEPDHALGDVRLVELPVLERAGEKNR